tara:strand:- start:5668 stop:7638 length:1971 start_codon:yes stop_codon:yes gene_type:complete
MIKFIFSLLIIKSNGFILNNYHQINNNINNIKMNYVPNYDPAKLINTLAKKSTDIDNWNLNNFLQEVTNKHIDSVSVVKSSDSINSFVIIDNNYDGLTPELNNLHFLETGLQKVNDIVIDSLIKNDIYYKIVQLGSSNNVLSTGANVANVLLNIVIIYLVISVIGSFFQNNQMTNGANIGMNFMKKESILIDNDEIKTTFDDVAGCDEAKYELEEIVDFLKSPTKYYDAGAKIPKGILLEGPPGTGKTLLARAVAGEANVSFIQVSASEFIQMFVGLGASRVRDLFNEAKKNSPCVIFIDEIDAVGKKRGTNVAGGNEEREQTLNQILTNMDGFDKTDNIIVLAATNRADVLDSALTRSGRFDRKVKVGLPDKIGRRKILNVHLKNKVVDNSTDLDEISQLTSGFSGADIENMANEAIILALRENRTSINSKYLIDAYEKITIGLPLNSGNTTSDTDKLVAYHEAGHTITALLFRDFYDVRKVTIIGNSNGAGGYTLFTSKEKYISYPTKKYFLSNLIITMAGRAAEMVLYNKVEVDNIKSNYTNSKIFDNFINLDITSGASGDLQKADNLARQYIKLFGYTEHGMQKFIQLDNPLSENIKSEVDKNVIKIMNYALYKAIEILYNNMDSFNLLASDLIEKKSLDIKYLNKIKVEYF